MVGVFLTEDDDHIFMQEANVITETGMHTYGVDSIGIDAFHKSQIQSISVPNTDTIAKYFASIMIEQQHKASREQDIAMKMAETAIPQTQFSYMTEGPVVTHH